MYFCNSFFTKVPLTALLILFFTGCSKKDQPASAAADITSFSIYPGKDKVNLLASAHSVNVTVPDSVVSGENLPAIFSLSNGASATVDQVHQVSGITENNFENNVIYTVTAADGHSQQLWTVQVCNNDYSMDWGLGHFIRKSVSRERSYEWYTDQGSSGNFAGFNCGPASVTMAIKWSDSSFTKTVQDARQTYETGGGWWFTNDIDKYLSDYGIPHAIIPLSADASLTGGILTHQLDNNQIIILCIDMNQVRRSTDSAYRIDKFYNTSPDWGHFFVVKGYRITDGELYFQIYDPYSLGLTYSDNSLRGKNRYYRYEDVAAASNPWWNYAFVIAKKGQSVDLDARQRAVDPAGIRHAHGL